MNGYRRGAVLGLAVAETFILLAFLLLLVALLGIVQQDEPRPEAEAANTPRVWVRPQEIETLRNAVATAHKAQKEADKARLAAERERDQEHDRAKQARKAQAEAEQARLAAERERDQEHGRAEQARKAQTKAEQARIAAERERDQANEAAEQERRNLALLHRKGKNPPCWYQIVSAGEGKTREKPYYLFNVAIYEDAIEMAPRTAPPGGAFDDGGGLYADEWKKLHIERLPYGRALSDDEFIEVVSGLVAQGRNRQVRTYECVFSVMVWDKTPDHAKQRWKDAHDRIVEGSFSAYTVRDLEWKPVEVRTVVGNRAPE